MKQTGLFFLFSVLLFSLFFPTASNIPKALTALVCIGYIIYFILNLKSIKIRFLAYPLVVLNLFLGWYTFEVSGLSQSNAVGLGYILIFGFMFVILPIMLVVLIIGAVIDIVELMKKRKE